MTCDMVNPYSSSFGHYTQMALRVVWCNPIWHGDVDVDDDVGVDGDVDDAVENAAVQKSIWHGGRPAVQSGKMTAAASGGHWIMLVLSGNKLLKHIHVC